MQATATRPPARLFLGALLILGLLAAVYYQRRSDHLAGSRGSEDRVKEAPATATTGGEPRQLPGGVTVQAGSPEEVPDPSSPALKREGVRLAEERLATFRKWAQYPPGSRPAREHPDQLYPRAPVVSRIPLSLSGQPSEHIALKLRQDRLAVVGDDSIQLGIRCEDSQGQVLPCVAESAQLSALPTDSAPPKGQRPVSFTADTSPEHEGELVATVRPLELQLVDRPWPLRVEVKLRAGRDPVEQGSALFDFMFTPEPPAVTTGKIREAVVDGSLVLYYGLQVKRAGRYVLQARLDDAQGKTFAYLEWNDLLAVGPQEVKLVVFGKLLLDEHPSMPLKLRDFDGFLLKEQVDPDREHIPPRTGYHYTTQVYPSSAFSAKEWQSEERTRHEREFERDVDEARK